MVVCPADQIPKRRQGAHPDPNANQAEDDIDNSFLHKMTPFLSLIKDLMQRFGNACDANNLNIFRCTPALQVISRHKNSFKP